MKRIEELLAAGIAPDEAQAIAEAETTAAAELVGKGFPAENAAIEARRQVKFARLVAAKMRAGLSKEQAETVASSQVANDERVAREEAEAAAQKTAVETAQARIVGASAVLKPRESSPSPEEVKAFVANEVRSALAQARAEEAETRQRLEKEHRVALDAAAKRIAELEAQLKAAQAPKAETKGAGK